MYLNDAADDFCRKRFPQEVALGGGVFGVGDVELVRRNALTYEGTPAPPSVGQYFAAVGGSGRRSYVGGTTQWLSPGATYRVSVSHLAGNSGQHTLAIFVDNFEVCSNSTPCYTARGPNMKKNCCIKPFINIQPPKYRP
eukprot:1195301-Prorocentrum_minimum.AAC.3